VREMLFVSLLSLLALCCSCSSSSSNSSTSSQRNTPYFVLYIIAVGVLSASKLSASSRYALAAIMRRARGP
jgi:uncharacterized membrane protein YadS